MQLPCRRQTTHCSYSLTMVSTLSARLRVQHHGGVLGRAVQICTVALYHELKSRMLCCAVLCFAVPLHLLALYVQSKRCIGREWLWLR